MLLAPLVVARSRNRLGQPSAFSPTPGGSGSANGGSGAATSTSKGIAAPRSVPSPEIASLTIGLVTLSAFVAGAGMILL